MNNNYCYKQIRPVDVKTKENFKDICKFEFNIPSNKRVSRNSLKIHVNCDLLFNYRGIDYTYQNSNVATPDELKFLTNSVQFWNITSNPCDSFFNDCRFSINNEQISYLDNYHICSYASSIITETEQKNRLNNCLNAVNQLEKTGENSYINQFINLGRSITIPPIPDPNATQPYDFETHNNAVQSDLSFCAKIKTFICEDEQNDLPSNVKIGIEYTCNRNFLDQLLFYAVPLNGNGPARSQNNGYYYNLDKNDFYNIDITNQERVIINSSINDIYITYKEYDVRVPLYKEITLNYTEIYSVTFPIPVVANYPSIYKKTHIIPHDIGAFIFLFRTLENNGKRQSNSHTIYDNFDINNYQIKYGNTLYPTVQRELNFKRYTVQNSGIRQDNNTVFKEYINQISNINDNNGSILNSRKYQMNPIFYYIVRRPENDINRTMELTFNIKNQTQLMEVVLMGIYSKQCTLKYDNNKIVNEINITEL
jgi:hypothetical protein